MNLDRFPETPVLGILRGVLPDMIAPLAEAVVTTGLPAIEITMNTKGASKLIAEMKKQSAGRFDVGAGTVLTLSEMDAALNAGATFIVMPVIVEDIVVYCAKNNIPVFPGALTPNEIYRAWHMGAAMVKVFPAKTFGPAYFKEVKAPLNDIKLMATGGISVQNAAEYRRNGADALSFGGSIFNHEWMLNNQYDLVTDEIKKLILASKRR